MSPVALLVLTALLYLSVKGRLGVYVQLASVPADTADEGTPDIRKVAPVINPKTDKLVPQSELLPKLPSLGKILPNFTSDIPVQTIQ